jgi:gamma-glutamyltranspeptidase / glutathione hydrolase
MPTTANKVAVATTSQTAADAAAEVADLGGNAVDCGIAAAICSINTQPGVCALAGGAFLTIWASGLKPITIDGNVAIPGKGLPAGHRPAVEARQLEYGGGIETLIGACSVAVPGALAALHLASTQYGRLEWRQLLGPTIRVVRQGFPFAGACHHYLEYSGDVIFGRSKDGHRALHHEDGALRGVGSTIVVPHLADTLDAIAREGARIFYAGEIGRRIATHVCERGGMLTSEDLESYEPQIRESLMVDAGDWQIATNPPPAIGGASLAAMLQSFGTGQLQSWDKPSIAKLVQVQEAVMSYRRKNIDLAENASGTIARFLHLARSNELLSKWASGSTVHTSSVDGDGLACAITASSGYGSGEMPASTGLWLNNCLGELELNRSGLTAAPPGKRLPSNMAPSAARTTHSVLAIGSPGADRITTALHQFLVNFIQLGLDLEGAVAHPRLHLKIDDAGSNLAFESGANVTKIGLPMTRYPDINMYFGGVVAALGISTGDFEVAADPRREGGTYIGPD